MSNRWIAPLLRHWLDAAFPARRQARAVQCGEREHLGISHPLIKKWQQGRVASLAGCAAQVRKKRQESLAKRSRTGWSLRPGPSRKHVAPSVSTVRTKTSIVLARGRPPWAAPPTLCVVGFADATGGDADPRWLRRWAAPPIPRADAPRRPQAGKRGRLGVAGPRVGGSWDYERPHEPQLWKARALPTET